MKIILAKVVVYSAIGEASFQADVLRNDGEWWYSVLDDYLFEQADVTEVRELSLEDLDRIEASFGRFCIEALKGDSCARIGDLRDKFCKEVLPLFALGA